MRSKALLVGAQAGFIGPWVHIEEGEWIVDPPSSVTLESNGITVVPADLGFVAVYGPGEIRACITPEYEGEDLFLKIRQDG